MQSYAREAGGHVKNCRFVSFFLCALFPQRPNPFVIFTITHAVVKCLTSGDPIIPDGTANNETGGRKCGRCFGRTRPSVLLAGGRLKLPDPTHERLLTLSP